MPSALFANVLEFVQNLEGPPHLGSPRAVAFSPDGRHLYVTAVGDEAVLVFDASGPKLELVATIGDADNGPGARGFPVALAFSDDGRHVYVSYLGGDSIVAFARDPASGELAFVQAVTDEVDGVEGIRNPLEMILSPDGLHVYAADFLGNAVAVFTRDPASGELGFVEAIFDDSELRLSGTYSMAFTPNGRTLYVVATRDALVTQFQRDAATGKLTFQDQFFGGGGLVPYDVAVSPDGGYLYITSNSLSVRVPIDEDTGSPLPGVTAYGSDIARDDGPDDHVFISPDGRDLYGIAFEARRTPLRVYERDLETGQPNLVETLAGRDDGLFTLGFPRDLAIHPDGDRLAVIGTFHDTLVLLKKDEGSKTLAVADVWVDGADGIDGLLGAYSVAVSPDGGHVYATGQWDNAVVVLARDRASGKLEFVEAHVDGVDGVEGLDHARAAAVSPDGRHVYATGRDTAAVAVFEREPTSGRLKFVGAPLPPLELPNSGSSYLAISPDGAHVYTRRAAFSRDAASGELSFLAEAPEELRSATSVVFSDDGRHAYVANVFVVYVLERDPATGSLTRLGIPSILATQCEFVDTHGSTVLCGPWSLAFSPDGHQLYASLVGVSGGVMAFERDAETGLLDHLGTFVEGEGYRSSVLPPDLHSIVADPDGRYVYLVSWSASSVVVMSRDRTTGELEFAEIHVDERAGVDGLSSARAAAVSPDGRHLYVASPDEDSVVVFEKNCVAGRDALCLNGERFRIDVDWRDFEGTTGHGRVVPAGSDDSGLFWFFNADNWEMLVKVLDGCAITDHFWVFAAATTNVEYTLTVTDLATGEVKSYFNPLGNAAAAITDTGALATCSAEVERSTPRSPVSRLPPSPPDGLFKQESSCAPGSSALCLNGGRFRVETVWRDFQGQTGSGRVAPVGSDDSGLFWFFNADNWEMLVKVLDGCAINDRFWVFSAATTNVEYTLRVTDTETGVVQEYSNPLGVSADAVTDTGAFATCD